MQREHEVSAGVSQALAFPICQDAPGLNSLLALPSIFMKQKGNCLLTRVISSIGGPLVIIDQPFWKRASRLDGRL
jgi:hypothetical protein